MSYEDGTCLSRELKTLPEPGRLEPSAAKRKGKAQGRVFSDKYEILDVIGRGGMGIVYKVRHRAADTILALKTLPSYLAGESDLVTRFHREARVMACLHHSNIVRLVDVGQDGEPYLVMDYVAGRDLSVLLTKQNSLGLDVLVDTACQVLEALAYAHSRTPSVVHRDVKPSNILIEEGTGRAVVTDFGIAKLLGEVGAELTIAGLPLGTPRYCAPEQREGLADVDVRADLYSFGVVLHDMVRSLSTQAAGSRIRGEWESDGGVRTLRVDGIPAPLRHVVLRATAATPDGRYHSADAMLRELREARDRLRSEGVPPRRSSDLRELGATDEGSRHAASLHGAVVPRLTALRSGLARISSRLAQRRRRAAEHAERNTIAVLGFENDRGDPESDWYSRALRSTFSTELGKLLRFSVVAPDVTGKLTIRDLYDPLRWARRLGVGWLVTGSFAVVHGRIRLDARIIDSRTGFQMAAGSINGDSERFHELQGRLVDETVRSFALERLAVARGSPQRETGEAAAPRRA